jgi:hypothetical protein
MIALHPGAAAGRISALLSGSVISARARLLRLADQLSWRHRPAPHLAGVTRADAIPMCRSRCRRVLSGLRVSRAVPVASFVKPAHDRTGIERGVLPFDPIWPVATAHNRRTGRMRYPDQCRQPDGATVRNASRTTSRTCSSSRPPGPADTDPAAVPILGTEEYRGLAVIIASWAPKGAAHQNPNSPPWCRFENVTNDFIADEPRARRGSGVRLSRQRQAMTRSRSRR